MLVPTPDLVESFDFSEIYTKPRYSGPMYFQDRLTPQGEAVSRLYEPDSDGLYYNLSGTVSNPVMKAGDVLAFSIGMEKKADIYIFAASVLALTTGPVLPSILDLSSTGGQRDISKSYYIWFPELYHESGLYALHIHNARFVASRVIPESRALYLDIEGYPDLTLPLGQRLVTFLKLDCELNRRTI